MNTVLFSNVIQQEIDRLKAACEVLGYVPDRTSAQIEGLQKAVTLAANTGACCK